MINIMSKLHCCGRNVTQLFQKGIIVSTKSLQLLYRDLKYTQDINNPSPLDVLYCLRVVILNKNQRTKTNTSGASDDSEFDARKELKISGVFISVTNNILREKSKSIGNVTLADDNTTQTEFTDLEENAFEYLCDWVARKLKPEFPYLEDNNETNSLILSTSSWVKHQSYGGLCKPSELWLHQAK
ncbi:hypothetical protein PR048_020279 [Dryococelus australis]|uniref:Transposable element P transposase-like C-terminal domain-containing protein n=1 Tax=Dryococelus australis TaxID=614101 RepID=A0ABQ9H5V6_9NEOP|nr:hypothetical protein PR048_020279 [Dryococelus australis]